jgi:hypothetical protein
MASDPRADGGVSRKQPERPKTQRQIEKIAHGQLPEE